MPRFDDDSCFGRLLDWDRGGYCSVAPEGEFSSSWRYLPGTMIIESLFTTDTGIARLTDFLVLGAGTREPGRLVRILNGLSGDIQCKIEVCPRFDYGEIIPRMQVQDNGMMTATGSNQGLVIFSDANLAVLQHRDLAGSVHLHEGMHVRLVLQFDLPELIDSVKQEVVTPAQIDDWLEHTRRWWAGWSERVDARQPDAQTRRSTIVLKALTYEQTGAIIAAPTTSLPEWVGGERNWDYRFSWVRDSLFAIRALHELGYTQEADRFHAFVQRSSAGSAEQLQVMYAVDGNRRLPELTLEWLEGYRASRPVRIGNAAAKQAQFDIYGELLEMAWEWHENGHKTHPDYWAFLVDVIDMVCEVWDKADHGIWEIRGAPRHYVHSKVMCWAALDRGIRLAEANRFSAPIELWKEVRERIRTAIEERGVDQSRNIFVQSFGSTELDAALLILPRVGFIAYDHPRMVRTADAIRGSLEHGGLIARYRARDGLRGPEGVFVPCTFWLATCLARQGRIALARCYYDRAIACANDLGLLSEEFAPETGIMLGNYPQGLSHVSQIMAWLALQEDNGPGSRSLVRKGGRAMPPRRKGRQGRQE